LRCARETRVRVIVPLKILTHWKKDKSHVKLGNIIPGNALELANRVYTFKSVVCHFVTCDHIRKIQ